MAINTELTTQELPAHGSNAIGTAPKAFELRDGGRVTVTSADVAFRVWFSNAEDVAIPAGALSFAMGDMPEFSLRSGSVQKVYCMVATDAGAGTVKIFQE